MTNRRLQSWASILALSANLLFALPATAASPTRMNDRQIAKSIVGRVLLPDEKIQQRAPPFGESFSANHVWLGTFRSFGLIMIYGTWSIENNALCVLPDGKDKECRELWIVPHTDAVSIRALKIWSEHNDLFVVRTKGLSKFTQDILNRHPFDSGDEQKRP